jgi:immune inhibitor A
VTYVTHVPVRRRRFGRARGTGGSTHRVSLVVDRIVSACYRVAYAAERAKEEVDGNVKRTLAVAFACAVVVALLAPLSAGAMPPQEASLVKALKARGVIPPGANAQLTQLYYESYVAKKLGEKGEDKGNPLASGHRSKEEKKGRPSDDHGRGKTKVEPAKDNILVLLVEFAGSDTGTDGTTSTGPLHNEMPAPSASDNTTYWIPDFSATHYQNMLFSRARVEKSMANYFLEQSGGTYTTTGQVTTQWVQLPHSEWYYGADNAYGSDDLNGPVWRVVADAVKAAGSSIDWAKYDTEDPNDLDGDGVTNEPDGYIDHLMVIHAGAGQEAGGGAQGDSAIWSHSWWVDFGTGGPGYGGVQTSNPNVWVGPYTIEPEDGTVGVFTHEFTHDLGAPDQYDTIYSGEESAGFWTLMSSGSWLGDANKPLGTSPSAEDIWTKYILGWANPTVIERGQTAHDAKLKSTSAAGVDGKAIKVNLPDYQYSVHVVDPVAPSTRFWYSGAGDSLDQTLSRQFTLGATPQLSFDTWFDIESGYDYGYVEVSEVANPGASDWKPIAGNLTDPTQVGVTGSSGGWVKATYDLSGYAGKTVWVRFRYLTDAGVALPGWAVDNIALDSFSDPVEGADAGWAAAGWTVTTGTDTKTAKHYYLAEWRQPTGFDTSMNGWYNWLTDVKAQFFRATPGMLLWYRNTQFAENWVGVHPWEGQLLLVDSHYPLLTVPLEGWPNGVRPLRTRIQLLDAAFSDNCTVPTKVTAYGTDLKIKSRPGVSVFNDSKKWYDDSFAPYFGDFPALTNTISSVKTPTYGVKIKVGSDSPSAARIDVTNK